MNAFGCATKDQFREAYGDIADHLVTHGYAVIDAWDAEASTLREISEHFGRAWLSPCSGSFVSRGILRRGLSASRVNDTQWQIPLQMTGTAPAVAREDVCG